VRRAALFVLFGLLTSSAASAGDPVGDAYDRDDAAHFSAGEEIARTVALTTGVPISPLLGVSGLGAWRWYRTPEAERAALPWYARPWFWATGLGLVFLFAANTTIGGLVPGLKKPMDFVEEHENKLSALVATPAVLLEVKRLLAIASPGLFAAAAPARADGLAVVAAAPLDAWLQPLVAVGLGVLYVACFFVVFLAFHAIQVLIALSPSMLLDLFLRAFRVSTLALLGLSSWIHPYLGATLGFAILFVALLVAGWSFRLTVYGSVFSWEFLAGRDGSADPASGRLLAFSQKGLRGVPPRTLGRLVADDAGGLDFRYRPWLILPRRRVAVPAGERALLKGAISPLLVRGGAFRAQALVRFPPRYRGRERELATRLGVGEVLDGRIVRGLRAGWRWLRETFAGGSAAASAEVDAASAASEGA
jgi:hypothetical protein